jgi:[ribosomal protein S5]-alanine N-acetyltransferase
MLIEQFRTKRLRAERLATTHLAELLTMHRDARLMATIGGVRSPEVTKEYLAINLHHWEQHGFGLWVFYHHGGKFVGRGGLRHALIEGVDEIEIAYALVPAFWGLGLASEIADKFLEITRLLEIKELVAFILTTNTPSRRVVEKMNFSFEKDFIYHQNPHALYRLRLNLS